MRFPTEDILPALPASEKDIGIEARTYTMLALRYGPTAGEHLSQNLGIGASSSGVCNRLMVGHNFCLLIRQTNTVPTPHDVRFDNQSQYYDTTWLLIYVPCAT